MAKNKLFQDFPPISTDTWKEKIIQDLKGADYEKKLVWKTDEGFDVQPFYREEDLDLPQKDVLPGDFPFVRSNEAKGNEWLVRQDVVVDNIQKANEKLLDIRMKGVDSFGLIFKNGKVPDESEVEQLLKNIRADYMELNFSCDDPYTIIQIIDCLAKKYNRELEKVKGSLEYCPLSRCSANGHFYVSKEKDFNTLSKLFHTGSHLPNFQLVTINGTIFKNAGAGIVSELAFTMAMAADYLTYLTDKGHDIDEITPRFRLHFGVSGDYFMEIAKFRAARYLWSKMANAYGLNDANAAKVRIHASNASWNKTLYDPYVNMLRTTTESMSAILGGVHSLSVLPFNEVFEQPTPFSERIARNQQLILKGESFFDKVADPASGSYYIENLTAELIQHAWELFLEVDEKGGYYEAFRQGFIQKKVHKEAQKKYMDIAMRKQSILGTNQYPNTSEHISDRPSKIHVNAEKNEVEILKPCRGAEAFEEIRLKTDAFSKDHPRPKTWMFTYGNLAMRKARAQFAGNFFGCAGFEVVDNLGFPTIEKGIQAAKEAKPEIVVICSSDEEYADIAIPVYEALKDQSVVVLAGYPKELVDQFKTAGLVHFIHIKSNVLEELSNYQQLIGIE
ncbi:MAG: methylmalonyl-CoA mutase small subunit [Marinilabiliales bacterium]|nr:MAG: methylmalonyl-CoA mutase small subunit [Marinilabiliales bacterium]